MARRVERREERTLGAEGDIVSFRREAREWARELGFNGTDETRVMTAASELARNTVVHGSGGTALLEVVVEGERTGIRLVFEDAGPGIADSEEALRDGFSTGRGLGLGLGGARRLGDELEIESGAGAVTRITWLRWRR